MSKINKEHEKFFKELMMLCEKYEVCINSPDEDFMTVEFDNETYCVDFVSGEFVELNITENIQIKK